MDRDTAEGLVVDGLHAALDIQELGIDRKDTVIIAVLLDIAVSLRLIASRE